MHQKNQIKQFIEDIESIVRDYTIESDILHAAKTIMEKFIQIPYSIPEDAFIPTKDRWAINLMYMPEDKLFSIVGGVWLPGQETLIHDHMTWAIIGMYNGEEKETLFKRTDDGSNPKLAFLDKKAERIRKKGDVILLDRDTIHCIENPFESPSLTIQIYGADIGNIKRHNYNIITGEITTFVKGYDSIVKI